MDELNLVGIVKFYVVLLISLVVHEAAHALVAKLGGDRTAYEGGQVSLNPMPHIRREPMGMVVLPLAMLLMTNGSMAFGFASTPINPLWAYRNPGRAALMAAAGPASNFLLAILAVFVLKVLITTGHAELGSGPVPHAVDPGADGVRATIEIAVTFLTLNVLLGLFNLVPLPPLDGASIVEGLFPKQTAPLYSIVRSQPLLSLIAVIVLWHTVIREHVFWPTVYTLFGFL